MNPETYGHLESLDYGIIIFYLALSMVIGLWFARRGTKNVDAYFIGGRGMSWWLVGISITATAFAADTPLWIGDMIYKRGIEGTWLHWAPGIGAAFYVFIIAPLWRKSGILTDLEFLELRFSGKAAAVLRGFNGLYYSMFWNIMMMAVGILSITTLMKATTGMDKGLCVLITMSGALIYSAVSGIWGVAATDFMQFFVTVIGSIILAVFAVQAVGGLEPMVAGVRQMTDWEGHRLNVLPHPGDGLGLPMMTLIYVFTVRWFEHTNYGYFVSQRLFASKSVKHALLGALVWVAIYWSLIPLPWILTILAAKVHLPELTIGQEAYPRMAMAVLPIGLKGVFMASMLAAFMSTYSSLLSWGSSYAINDLYRRFLVKDASTRHYVLAGQLVMIPMGLIAAAIALYADTVLQLLFYVLLATTGVYTVHLCRWLWWRVSAWSEVAALASSLIFTLFICFLIPEWMAKQDLEKYYGHRMLFVAGASLVVWLVVTFLTPAVDEKVLQEFYKRLNPPGFWGPVRRQLGMPVSVNLSTIVYCWSIMLLAIFGTLVGVIKLCLGDWIMGGFASALGLLGIILAVIRAVRFKDELPAE